MSDLLAARKIEILPGWNGDNLRNLEGGLVNLGAVKFAAGVDVAAHVVAVADAPEKEKTMNGLYDIDVQRITGETIKLGHYKGKVLLIVNTASKCAYTPQYEGLEDMYARYRERGLVVAGFPSNDFGSQEPGSEKQVRDFCRLTYGVQFPMFAKTVLNAKTI